jgi:hypothetical protein
VRVEIIDGSFGLPPGPSPKRNKIVSISNEIDNISMGKLHFIP